MKRISKIARPDRFFMLLLLSFAIFGGFIGNEFHFDDYSSIINNPKIRNLTSSVMDLWNNFLNVNRDLTQLTFALNYHFHQLWPPGFAIANFILHAGNGFLLYLVIIELFQQTDKGPPPASIKRRTIAFLTACLFISQPLAVNTVSYITQRHGLLLTTFYLSGFYCFLLARMANGKKRVLLLLSTAICFLLGIHSKPNAVTLPLICICFDLLHPGTIRQPFSRKFITYFLVLALLFALLFIYSLQAGFFNTGLATAGFSSANLAGPWQTFLTQSQIIHCYLGLLLLPWPDWLCADRYFPVAESITTATVTAWLGHLVFFAVAVACYIRKMRVLSFGIVWFYVTLAPFLFLPIQDRMVDYRTYLPSVGFFMIIAEMASTAARKMKTASAIYVVFTLVCIGYLASGWQRNIAFRTEISFWTDVINKNPDQPRPYNNRGLAWSRLEKYDQAAIDFNNAIRTSSGYPLAYGNAGDVYLKQGKIDAAIQYYEMYNRIRPEDPEGFIRLGNGYSYKKSWQQAITYYTKAKKYDQHDQRILYNLGLAYEHDGQSNLAMNTLRELLKSSPDHLQGNGNLGAILYRNGQRSEAAHYFQKALSIDSNYTPALVNLIAYHAGTGDIATARQMALDLRRLDGAKAQELLDLLDRKK